MKVLSFVIPAYNSEQFLDKCIPSFLAREVLDQLEILIVNDGSTDATAETAEKYCRLYPGSVRLISQENKGHGGALNTGCAAATGKFWKPVDADDWVETQNLPEFVRFLEQCDSDVVLTHHNTIDISTGEVRKWKSYPPEFGKSYSMEELMAQWRSYYRSLTFHGITYNTAFYREHGIRLSEHVFYEDYEFATFPCCHAKTVTPLDLFVYDYRIGDVNQSVSDASRLKRIGHLETVLQRMLQENQNAADLSQGGRDYVAMKTQELLLSYLTTVLLVEPDKKKGRKMARDMVQTLRDGIPQAYELAHKKYQIFCLMNRLHISKASWEKFLKSKLYNTLRRNRDFS